MASPVNSSDDLAVACYRLNQFYKHKGTYQAIIPGGNFDLTFAIDKFHCEKIDNSLVISIKSNEGKIYNYKLMTPLTIEKKEGAWNEQRPDQKTRLLIMHAEKTEEQGLKYFALKRKWDPN